MKRRDFITVLGGVVLAPLAASGQQAGRTYRIGILTPSARSPAPNYDGLFDELRQHGFVEGKNLVVDERGFAARFERFNELATGFVEAGVDAILCGGDAAIRAAQQATRTIPIIGVTDDFVGAGLVPSLSRPGLNTTGISMLASDLDGKRQEILTELVPNARRIAALSDPRTTQPRQIQILQEAARARGVALSIYPTANIEDVPRAVGEAKAAGTDALQVLASPLFNVARQVLIERTAALRVPAIYHTPEMALEGGLSGYGPRFLEVGRMQARVLVKVFRGAKPADVPVEQPTKFELIINLGAAKLIGLEVPPLMLTRADQLVE